MRTTIGGWALVGVATLFSLSGAAESGAKPGAKPQPSALTIREKAAHVFDRLAFGARPGEVEKLASQGQVGIDRWIEAQLHPEKIADASADQKLSRLGALKLSTAELNDRYKSLKELGDEVGIDPKNSGNDGDEATRKRLRELIKQRLGALKAEKKLPPGFASLATSDDIDAAIEARLPARIEEELVTQKLVRAVESPRQLEEVLVDFWFNHFNVDVRKGAVRWMLPEYEREVIRRHLFGSFHDLLKATATSPAMLFYLDNHLSQTETPNLPPGGGPREPRFRRGPRGGAVFMPTGGREGAPKPKRPNGGLNENYAREILELHTLGVDGGYTQKDVRELARVLTGWSIEKPRQDARFLFRERVHDRGEKTVLGARFAAGGGMEEGERALELLSRHPATARHLARQLCAYFVSDHPPETLVKRVAKRFAETQGNLTEIYREIFRSPEFWSRAAYRAKVKTPFQFVVSAVRALGGEVETDEGLGLGKVLNPLGEPLYQCAPPTGYKDDAETWVNPGSLVNRLKFANRLSADRVDGVVVRLPSVRATASDDGESSGGASVIIHKMEGMLLHDRLSPNSEKVILSQFQDENRLLADGELRPALVTKATALILGSPEFQKR